MSEGQPGKQNRRGKRLRYDPNLDYYVALGINPAATPDEIQSAFRQRAKTLHPDRNKEQRATEHFQLLTEAYAVLSDPPQRAEYDQLRAQSIYGGLEALRQTSAAYHDPAGQAHWRQVIGGLLKGPYRYVFMALGVVIVANVAFIIATRFNVLPTETPAQTEQPPNQSVDQTPVSAFMPEPRDPNGLERCDPGALIVNPANGASLNIPFEVSGTASAAYRLEWLPLTFDQTGRAQLSDDWRLLSSGDTSVTRGILASRAQTANLPMPGRIRLRLTVNNLTVCQIVIWLVTPSTASPTALR